MLWDCSSYSGLEVCEALSRYSGSFLSSRLLHFGLTDATLCWNEIGLWVYSGNTQVHNSEVKMMEEKWWFVKSHVLIIIEQFIAVVGLVYFPWTNTHSSVPWLNCGPACSQCTRAVYLCVQWFFLRCWSVLVIPLLFRKVILRSLLPLSVKISHSWRDFHLPLIIRLLLPFAGRAALSTSLPSKVKRLCYVPIILTSTEGIRWQFNGR